MDIVGLFPIKQGQHLSRVQDFLTLNDLESLRMPKNDFEWLKIICSFFDFQNFENGQKQSKMTKNEKNRNKVKKNFYVEIDSKWIEKAF